MRTSFHICDDHPMIVESLYTVIDENFENATISTSNSRDEVFDCLKKEKPDILVLDLNLKGKNMLSSLSTIAELSVKTRVVIFSNYVSAQNQKELNKQNVYAILSKYTDPLELSFALNEVLKKRKYFPGNTKKESTLQSVDDFVLLESLTKREKNIFKFVVEGYTNQKISEELFISIETVKTHRKNMYKKLNIKGVRQLITFAIENNLITQ